MKLRENNAIHNSPSTDGRDQSKPREVAPVEDTDRSAVYALITKAASIDCFCVDCDQPSVFLGAAKDIGVADYEFHLRDRIFTRDFLRSRVHHHRVYFHFRLKDQVLSKIGQSPSMADISESELRPYRKVLTNEDYRELTRAVGLASHGVGLGSFVYLRRIFEELKEGRSARPVNSLGSAAPYQAHRELPRATLP